MNILSVYADYNLLIDVFFRQLFAFLGPRYRQVSFLVAILAVASVAGIGNLTSQWNIIGEFENWPHEEVKSI